MRLLYYRKRILQNYEEYSNYGKISVSIADSPLELMKDTMTNHFVITKRPKTQKALEPSIPKEKAKKIYCKYIDAYGERNLQVSDYMFAKQCALIAVDEIIIELEYHQRHPETKDMMIKIRISQAFQYWKAVKQEIEKL